MPNILFYSKEMFRPYLENTELKIPENFKKYNPVKYPHFNLFMIYHLGMYIDDSFIKENANIIAAIPEEELKNITPKKLANLGVKLKD